jgi:putative NIF3 family GTP cyclohydrolase 1 type 2
VTVFFDRAALLGALNELANGLDSEGASATIRIVGGAALSIGYYERAATTDVDALLTGDIEAISAKGWNSPTATTGRRPGSTTP